jgi:L-asparaginase II
MSQVPIPMEPGRVILERGGILESVHRVHVTVVGPGGADQGSVGDPAFPTFLRSAAKPFQVLPLLDDGVADALGVSDEEIALCCGSHGGEPEHVLGVERLLARGGLDGSALACGAHPPMLESEARRLVEAGIVPERIHNNCSGKHAGMLLLAQAHGWPLAGYHEAGHPVQERMRREVAHWLGLAPSDLGTGVDGCGVQCFSAPLRSLALGFQRLGDEWVSGAPGPMRVAEAMLAHPHRVAGTGRLCTLILQGGGGRVLVKVGAEGVYGGCARLDEGQVFGFALKVEDGSRRAVEVALVSVLESMGLLEGEPLRSELAPWRPRAVRNTRGEAAGWLRPEIPLQIGAPHPGAEC